MAKNDALRQQAESKLSERKQKTGTLPEIEADTRQIIHELQVHQIEMEMQNEELRRIQVELEEARARYFDLYDLAPVGYLTINEKGLILEANLSAVTLLGVARRELVNRPIHRFILAESQDMYYLHRKWLFETGKPQTCELRMVKKDGTIFWAHLDAAAARDARGKFMSRVTLSDITERKHAEAELRRARELLEVAHRKLEQNLVAEQLLARVDDLTGLCNRRYFFELANQEFSLALRYPHPLTVFMFDVDRFKQVNDISGHAVGDKVLAGVARVAAAQIRAVDVLARYGGDEFVILLPQTDAQAALPLAERIRQRVEADEDLCGVTLSIGLAEMRRAPLDENIENVIQRADKALYLAKNEGRNRTMIYDRRTPEGET